MMATTATAPSATAGVSTGEHVVSVYATPHGGGHGGGHGMHGGGHGAAHSCAATLLPEEINIVAKVANITSFLSDFIDRLLS